MVVIDNRIIKTALLALFAFSLYVGVVAIQPVGASAGITAQTESSQTVELTKEIVKLRKQVKLLKKESAYNHKLYHKFRIKLLRKKRYWSRADLDFAIHDACVKYDMQKSTRKLKDIARDIVFERPRESGGDTHAKNGQYKGLFQFGKSWAFTDKYDGVDSTRRFVRAYHDGGDENLIQHWGSTWNDR